MIFNQTGLIQRAFLSLSSALFLEFSSFIRLIQCQDSIIVHIQTLNASVFFLRLKQVTGAYSNSDAIRCEICFIMPPVIHKMHENATVSGRCGLDTCWAAVVVVVVVGGRRCTVMCKIMILFVVLWFSYVHTNLFIDLVCLMDLDVSKGARLDSAEAQRDGTL